MRIVLILLGLLYIATIRRPKPSIPHWTRLTGRDARGRFVSRAWTTAARTYSATDLAWFASRPQW